MRTVSAVDVAGALPTRQAKVGDEPEGVAISTDGARLFVASEASDTVTMLDSGTLKVRATTAIEGRPRGLLAAADGSVIYVSVELGGKLAMLSARDGKLLKSIDLAAGDKSMRPMGMVEAPGGKTLFVTTGRHGAVLEVDPAAGRVVRTIAAVGARPWGIGSVDGGKLLVTANGPSGDISLVDRASGKVTSRIKVGVSPWGMAVTKP
jgi:YVTN family beta-propeller protein